MKIKIYNLSCLILVFLLLAPGCKKQPTEKHYPLHEAVWEEDIKQIKSLIASGADVNAKDALNWPPLHSAALKGRKDVMELLIAHGANVNEKGGWQNCTLLHEAVRLGNKEMIQLLLSVGADVNAKDENGHTPAVSAAKSNHKKITELLIEEGTEVDIFIAAYIGDLDKIKSLIENGSDVSIQDGLGDTPLHATAQNGHYEAVQLLINQGADVNKVNKSGKTPLQNAAKEGHKNIVELLIDNGAKINTKDKHGYTPLYDALFSGRIDVSELLINGGADIDMKDSYGSTALHIAAGQGDRYTVENLIGRGANVNVKEDLNGDTPLYDAIRGGYKDIVELLINSGADVNSENDRGVTPLRIALSVRNDIAELLIAKGASIQDDPMLLYIASSLGRINISELLIRKGADVNVRDIYGRTPLHAAVTTGQRKMAEVLLTHGADIEAKDRRGRTPLHTAVSIFNSSRRKEIIDLLIEKGADVNTRTTTGFTPLHFASRDGYTNVVEMLIANDADVGAKTNRGYLPIDFARSRNHKEVVDLLSSKESNNLAVKIDNETPIDFSIEYEYKKEPQPRTDLEQIVLNNTTFAFELYQQLRTVNGNLFISPYSISTSLALTYAGARDKTEKQMAETLHFSLDQKRIHTAFRELRISLNKAGEAGNIKLCTANSLWPQKGCHFLNDFLSLAQEYYDVSITAVDYINEREAARQTINTWVMENTEDKIQELIKPQHINNLTRLILTNAIYFKGIWSNPFDPDATKESVFYVSPGQSVRAPMMSLTEQAGYAEFNTLQILELSYLGDSLSMLILLPKKIDGYKQLENSLTVRNLVVWRQHLEKKHVDIFLPKFNITSEFDLKSALQSMGMTDAFIFPCANFAGFDGDPYWFYISDVVHKAHIVVSEEGTEAAAATAVVAGFGGTPLPPPEFLADHPFLFLIQEKKTGNILFIGRITDPTQVSR